MALDTVGGRRVGKSFRVTGWRFQGDRMRGLRVILM
jgi:hypothetical protein